MCANIVHMSNVNLLHNKQSPFITPEFFSRSESLPAKEQVKKELLDAKRESLDKLEVFYDVLLAHSIDDFTRIDREDLESREIAPIKISAVRGIAMALNSLVLDSDFDITHFSHRQLFALGIFLRTFNFLFLSKNFEVDAHYKEIAKKRFASKNQDAYGFHLASVYDTNCALIESSDDKINLITRRCVNILSALNLDGSSAESDINREKLVSFMAATCKYETVFSINKETPIEFDYDDYNYRIRLDNESEHNWRSLEFLMNEKEVTIRNFLSLLFNTNVSHWKDNFNSLSLMASISELTTINYKEKINGSGFAGNNFLCAWHFIENL